MSTTYSPFTTIHPAIELFARFAESARRYAGDSRHVATSIDFPRVPGRLHGYMGAAGVSIDEFVAPAVVIVDAADAWPNLVTWNYRRV